MPAGQYTAATSTRLYQIGVVPQARTADVAGLTCANGLLSTASGRCFTGKGAVLDTRQTDVRPVTPSTPELLAAEPVRGTREQVPGQMRKCEAASQRAASHLLRQIEIRELVGFLRTISVFRV